MSSGNRLEDWPTRLNQAIQAARWRPFVWGEHDCCLFAANVVRAMTGNDPAADLRGRYRSRSGAGRLIKDAGGLDALVDRMARAAGLSPIPVAYAHRGDPVLVETEGGPALGICCGPRIACATHEGLVFVDRARALKAWRV